MLTAASFPLIVTLDILPASVTAAALSSVAATTTAVLSATRTASSTAAEVALIRLLAVSVTVAEVAFV